MPFNQINILLSLNTLFLFLVYLGTQNLRAQTGNGTIIHEVGPAGPLTSSNLIPNLREAKTEQEVIHITKETRLRGVSSPGLTQAYVNSVSSRQLRSVSPISAQVLLRDFYHLGSEEVNLIYESSRFHSGWHSWKPILLGTGLVIATWGGVYAASQFVPVILPLLAGPGLVTLFVPYFLSEQKPSVVASAHLFHETAVDVSPGHVRAIRALIHACSR